jgi:hypothetical protein
MQIEYDNQINEEHLSLSSHHITSNQSFINECIKSRKILINQSHDSKSDEWFTIIDKLKKSIMKRNTFS